MKEIIEKLQQKTDVSAYSTNFIRNLIRNRMLELKMVVEADYKEYIENSVSELETLESQLRNSYSQFFRNRLTFETLSHVILPRLATQKAGGDEVRIWSAGCAGGHEAYSLAIVFETFNKFSSTELKYRIFATDRDYSEIEHAVLGEYVRQDIGNLTNSETEFWFKAKGNNYKINSDIKKNIQFELFDLLDKECTCPPTSIFGEFDIIICANVLMYYNEDFQQQIISNFQRCISTNGIIITGEAEREILFRKGFVEIYPQSCIFRV
jgi:chemotaxis methyl-accepting protein methylase